MDPERQLRLGWLNFGVHSSSECTLCTEQLSAQFIYYTFERILQAFEHIKACKRLSPVMERKVLKSLIFTSLLELSNPNFHIHISILFCQ